MQASQETKQTGLSRDQLMALASELKGLKENKFKNTNVDVERKGTQIVLPEGMTTEEGVECLQRKIKEEQTLVSVYEEIEAFPLDGAYAFMKVLQKKYGWAEPVPKKTFFGDQPPVMVNLEIEYGKHTQVIWGDFRIPGIDGVLTTGANQKNGRFIFVMGGKVKQRFKAEVQELARLVREHVKDSSIYKGKAIRLKTDEEGHVGTEDAPSFLDLSRVNPEELVFPDNVMEQVQTNLFTPIEHTERCREYKIPLKRGVLLEGRYGTGKTLTAYVTAKKCEENKWSFIYLDKVAGLKDALLFAKQYSPAVVFAEDIDRTVAGERSVEIDDVLNTIDGVDSKGGEVITILTSNHVDKINKAMLRPGRLDAVISTTAPDAKAAEKLVRIYARGLIEAKEKLDEAGRELDGQIPAVIREVVERSKLYAISQLNDGSPLRLSGKDLAAAARGMKHHLSLMETPKTKAPTAVEAIGQNLNEIVKGVLNGRGETIDKTFKKAEKILEHVEN